MFLQFIVIRKFADLKRRWIKLFKINKAMFIIEVNMMFFWHGMKIEKIN